MRKRKKGFLILLLFSIRKVIMRLVEYTKIKKNLMFVIINCLKEEEMNGRKEITEQYILAARKMFQDDNYDVQKIVQYIIENLDIHEIPVNVWQIARHLGLEVLEANFKNENVSGSIIVTEEMPDLLQIVNAFSSKTRYNRIRLNWESRGELCPRRY